MIKIVQQNDPVLRKVAAEVALADISKKKVQKILADMHTAVREQDDGVAIAAPQIGHSMRIFVVAGKIFDKSFMEGKSKTVNPKYKDLVFINPTITKMSKDKKSMPEGCLSVRWLYGTTRRASKVTVHAFDEEGNEFTHDASGLLAQIFQHEVDHLDGILFIDKAKNIQELPPPTELKHE